MKRLLFILLMIFPVLLSACNTGPKVEECLIGVWEINDPDAFGRAVLPEGAFPSGALNFRRGSNEIAYKFDDTGAISVLAVEWQNTYDFDVDQDNVMMGMYINGYVVGKYEVVDDNRVMVTYVSAPQQNIEYQAVVEGEFLADTTEAVEFLPLFVNPSNIADVICSKDTLSLTLLNRSDLESPITFTRQIDEASQSDAPEE